MLTRIFVSTLLSTFLFSTAHATPPVTKIDRVIYITLDGTRWQEALKEHKYLPLFWEKYASQCKIYGVPDSTDTMEVASIPISLPSYQSQMSGEVQPCSGNDCGRIQVETLPETLVHQCGFRKKDVAIFSSWYVMQNAAEHIEGTVYVNNGNLPAVDPDTQEPDRVMSMLNDQQNMDHPEGQDRFDKYTFAQALHYLKKFKPKFMWIALQDTDEMAHVNNWPGYVDALTFYDQALDKLFKMLVKLDMDKTTMVIITTDHGRGKGKNWTSHGPQYPASKQTWAFVYNGELTPVAHNGQIIRYSTLSIKPTVEAVFQKH